MGINTDDPADHSEREDVDPSVLGGGGESTKIEDEGHDHDGDLDFLGGTVGHGDISIE